MVLGPIFYDISSSDDEEEDRNRGRNGSTGPTGLSPHFSKVFNMDLKDDDVVIIEKPTVMGTVKRDKPRPIRTVMDDDECCILDTDPGVTEVTDIVPPLDSDELVMTGEKGPVACRDFPHARYLCVHYPFKTTPHAKFCAQCHCYVCDSLAPCTLWGDGSSSNDHCHASDESRWKTLRKLAKYGSVPSRTTPVTITSPIAVPSAAPTSASLSDLEMIPMGSSRFVPSSVTLLDTSSPSPISQSPVGAGAPRQGQGNSTPVKKDPLIIKLKSKARGKPSQPPHLGVRSPRPHSGTRSALPSPRTAPAPPGRPREEIPAPGVQLPQFGRAGSGTVAGMPQHHSQSVPAFRTVPGRVAVPPLVQFPLPNVAPYFSPPLPSDPPPVHTSRTTVNSNAVPSYYPAPAPAPAPPLPTSPPPYIPPPPSHAYTPSAPGAYDYPPPGVFGQGADATAAGFAPPVSHVSDSRYVSVSPAPFSEGHSGAQPYDYLDQGYRSPVDSAHHPSSSYVSSHGGNADILAGATEGWVEDAFGNGIIGPAPDHDQQSTSSLNDVLEQMAGDDYLWDQFPSW